MCCFLWMTIAAGVVGASTTVKFQSSNYPHHYIRHSGYKLYINTDDGSDLFDKDSTFLKKAGLNGVSGYYSFESVNYPGHYIRHSGFRLRIDAYANTDLFFKDASWKELPALNGRSGYNSYESANYPERVFRHRDSEIWLDTKRTDDLFKNDASFKTGPSFFSPQGYWQRVGGFGGGGSLTVITTIGVTEHEEEELTETFGVSVTSTVSAGLEFKAVSASTELSTTISSEIAQRSLWAVSRTKEVTRTFTCPPEDDAMYQWVTSMTESGWVDQFQFEIRSNDIWCVSDDSMAPRCPFGCCGDEDCQTCDSACGITQNAQPLPQQPFLDDYYVFYLAAFLLVLLSINVVLLCYRICCATKNGRARYQKVKVVDSDVDASEAEAINI